MICIYKITNSINEKVYVGQTKNFEKRVKFHKKDYVRENNERGRTPLYEDMRKYGFEAFNFEVLQECDESELDNLEEYYIKHFNSVKEGYNRSAYANSLRDPEMQSRIRTNEYYEKQGRRMSEWNTKQWQDEKYRTKKSKDSSELQKKRLEDKQYYETLSNRMRAATEKMKKKICQYTLDGQLIATYGGIREAERATGIGSSQIVAVAKGKPKRKTAGGYIWKYLQ